MPELIVSREGIIEPITVTHLNSSHMSVNKTRFYSVIINYIKASSENSAGRI